MEPYIDLIATSQEMDLVTGLADRALTADQITEMLGTTREETRNLLKEAYRRDLVNRESHDGATTYSASTFYANMDYWTSFETGSWLHLPLETRKTIAEWQMQEFIRRWTPALAQIERDPDTWIQIKNRDVLLLEEALNLVAAAGHICLLPCPCKTTSFPNSPIVEGSMRLGERARLTLERGQGRSLTVEEAQAHLLTLDRMGLIHTGPRDWRRHDPNLEWISHGNCHPAYSFPFQAGLRLGLAKVYPRAHYLARIDWEVCTHCGVCTGRCPFGALYHDGTTVSVHGAKLRQIRFDPERCWGCGLCATACPETAIVMKAL
jgi:ferredoxin